MLDCTRLDNERTGWIMNGVWNIDRQVLWCLFLYYRPGGMILDVATRRHKDINFWTGGTNKGYRYVYHPKAATSSHSKRNGKKVDAKTKEGERVTILENTWPSFAPA